MDHSTGLTPCLSRDCTRAQWGQDSLTLRGDIDKIYIYIRPKANFFTSQKKKKKAEYLVSRAARVSWALMTEDMILGSEAKDYYSEHSK